MDAGTAGKSRTAQGNGATDGVSLVTVLLTVAEAAERLRVSPRTVQWLLTARTIRELARCASTLLSAGMRG